MIQKLVSIIIPCYNAEKFLLETLDSIFSQTYKDYEVIVIDDGSTDGSRKIITSFKDKVKSVFTNNQGASTARNIGTGLAKGSFFQYLDADDMLTHDSLENKVKALTENNTDVAYCDWQKLEEKEDGSYELGHITKRSIEDIHPNAEIAVFTSFWSPPAALMYKREIVSKIGLWNELLPIIQDARFLLDAALYGAKFVHVASLGAYYREHKRASLSRKNSQAFIQDCFLNATQVHNLWEKTNNLDNDHRSALLKVYGYIARASFEGDKGTFLKALKLIRKIDPKYIPREPLLLSLLSRLIGYENAESAALVYRKIKRLINT